MAPTRGKDKVPRKRRGNTPRELEEKRRKRLLKAAGIKQATTAFVPRDTGGEAPVADEEGRNNIIDAPDVNTTVEDDDVNVETVRTVYCDSVDDPNDDIEEFDDSADYDDSNSPNEPSVGREGGLGLMNRLLPRILCQIESEEKANPPFHEKWLVEYLKQHGFWLRSEALPFVASRLRFILTDNEVYCLRDVRVWMADLEFGLLHGTPACPTCGRGSKNIRVNCYPKNHPGRRIFTFDTHYWLMSRQHICNDCQRESRKEANSNQKIHYTFLGYNEKTMLHFPHNITRSFPAVLSHRSGLDKRLLRSIRPMADSVLTPWRSG